MLISGCPCIGKSLISTILADKLNISNVLSTKIVWMVMKNLDNKYFTNYKNLSECKNDYDFDKYCKVVRRGCNTDIKKCLVEGKAVIIEG